MLRIVWVPKIYKNFSFLEIIEECQDALKEAQENLVNVKLLNSQHKKMVADWVAYEIQYSNFSEEEKEQSLRELISYMKQFN